jgi:hypothetical protein
MYFVVSSIIALVILTPCPGSRAGVGVLTVLPLSRAAGPRHGDIGVELP